VHAHAAIRASRRIEDAGVIADQPVWHSFGEVKAWRSVRLLVVVAVPGGLSPLEPLVDFVGVRVPPFAHPVLEAG
jgi:hypothetical protein